MAIVSRHADLSRPLTAPPHRIALAVVCSATEQPDEQGQIIFETDKAATVIRAELLSLQSKDQLSFRDLSDGNMDTLVDFQPFGVTASEGDMFLLGSRFKEDVRFEQRDICESMPCGPFDIILCRNLAFTYFEEALQREILQKLLAGLREDGVLVTGLHESPPTSGLGLTAEAPAIYERTCA